MRHFISTGVFSLIRDVNQKSQELESIKCLIKTGTYSSYQELTRLSAKKRQLELQLRTLRASLYSVPKKHWKRRLARAISKYGPSLCHLLKRAHPKNLLRSLCSG